MAEEEEPTLSEAEKWLVDEAIERVLQREKDLMLYGCYIEVKGERVDPLDVRWESVKQPEKVWGKSLVAMIRDKQKEAGASEETPASE